MYHFIENKVVKNSDYYKRQFSIHLFPELMLTIFGVENPSGRITPEKLINLEKLIDEKYVFISWPTQKSFEKNAWSEKREDTHFKRPTKLIKHILNGELNKSKEEIDAIFDKLKERIHTYGIDEYYGEYVWFQYIKVSKEELNTF